MKEYSNKLKEWLNIDTGEFKTLEDGVVIKGINWIEIPEDAEEYYWHNDESCCFFLKNVDGEKFYQYLDKSVWLKWYDFNENSLNQFKLKWKREKLQELVSNNESTVNHPKHYVSDPCGVEAIEITSLLPACISNATKYIWREGKKDSSLQELEKALWYINYSIDNNLPSTVNDLTDSMHFEELITKVKKHWSGWKYVFIDAVYWGDQQQMKRAIEGMVCDIKEVVK